MRDHHRRSSFDSHLDELLNEGEGGRGTGGREWEQTELEEERKCWSKRRSKNGRPKGKNGHGAGPRGVGRMEGEIGMGGRGG